MPYVTVEAELQISVQNRFDLPKPDNSHLPDLQRHSIHDHDVGDRLVEDSSDRSCPPLLRLKRNQKFRKECRMKTLFWVRVEKTFRFSCGSMKAIHGPIGLV
jgi:hypothetical protein